MVSVSAVSALTACSDMASIDRRVDRLVQARSESLGGGSLAPATRPLTPEVQGPTGARLTAEQPPSTNPAPDELEYREGDTSPEAVLARLESYSTIDPDTPATDLREAFRIAQRTGREFRSAEEEYLLSAIALLIERHRWGPRLFDDITTELGATGNDGVYDSAVRVVNELRATRRLPYGGEVEARLITRAAQQLTALAGDQYTQSSQIVLGANIPLLRGAGDVAREDLIQAERDLVYAARSFEDFRRRYLVDIARDYFSLVAQSGAIENAEQRLASVIRLQERTTALVEAGRESPFKARNVEQNVLTSRNSLIAARESYLLAVDRFKVRLGLDVSRPLRIAPVSLELPDPDVTVTRSAELALNYRLDYQNQRDQTDDARRRLANARNGTLPDLNLSAGAAFNTDKSRRRGRLDFDTGDTDYTAGVTFSLPLDREIERLNVRTAAIQLQRQVRQTDQLRDTIILDARRAVREIDRARNALALLQKAVEINQLRAEELELRSDEVEPQDKLDAENELLQSRNDYQDALRDLRVAILEYLLQTGQLRVASDGVFQPLRGMTVRMIGPGEQSTPPSGTSPPPGQPPAGEEKEPQRPGGPQPP